MNITAHPMAPEEVMAFLDGELSAAEGQAVSAHIERCADCAKLAEQFRSTSQSLARWNVEAIPVKLEKSIADSTTKAGSRLDLGKPNVFIRSSFWSWKQWALAGGGAVATLLFVIGVSLPSRSPRAMKETVTLVAPAQEDRDKLGTGTIGKLEVPRKLANSDGHSSPSMGVQLTQGYSNGAAPMASPSIIDAQPMADQLSNNAPMIARTVSLSIVVKDFTTSRSLLDSVLAKRHGYFAQLNINTPENSGRTLQASLRIPAPALASALADLRALGRVDNESQSGEEVSQQHTDLLARLKTSRETEERFRAILAQRTGKLADVLQVEEEIARVRGDIERMEAEQKDLERRVSFATVELQLTEEYRAQLNPPAASVSTRIYNAFVKGYHDASETILGIVFFFAENGPTLLIWLAILALPAILVWRRYRKALATL
jgi:hypothetical protein